MQNSWEFSRKRGRAIASAEIGSFSDTAKGGDMGKEDRGFASMDKAKQRAIASKGGRAAHEKGTAHEWSSDEAREAGRKGGLESHARRRAALSAKPATEADLT
jgi:general stress protein YciG